MMMISLLIVVVLLIWRAETKAFPSMFGAGRLSVISTTAISANKVNEGAQQNDTMKADAVDRIGSVNSTSSSYRKKRPPKRMVVSFVNGIYHTEAEWQEICDELKVLFNQPEIRPFYNPSSGFWMRDALGAGYELVRRPNDLLSARKLAAHLRNALKEVGPNGRVLHLAHSGGAILTYLAAKYHLSVAETDRIDVTTFGGGRSITQKYFKGRIVNYYARNDPLVLLDRRAGQLVKRVPGLPSDRANITTYPPCEVKDRKHNTSFVFLRGVANNPIFDHSMTGPTYLGALKLEAEDFLQRMARLKATEFSEAGVIRKFRKQASELTGMHHFWGDVAIDAEVQFRRARKQAASVTGFHGFFSGKRRRHAKQAIIVTDADAEEAALAASANNETMEAAALSSGDIVQAEVAGGLLEWTSDLAKSTLQRLFSMIPVSASSDDSGGDGTRAVSDSGEVEVELTTEILATPLAEALEGVGGEVEGDGDGQVAVGSRDGVHEGGSQAQGSGWGWGRFTERLRGAFSIQEAPVVESSLERLGLDVTPEKEEEDEERINLPSLVVEEEWASDEMGGASSAPEEGSGEEEEASEEGDTEEAAAEGPFVDIRSDNLGTAVPASASASESVSSSDGDARGDVGPSDKESAE